MLTVKRLKEKLESIPDDDKVLIAPVESCGPADAREAAYEVYKYDGIIVIGIGFFNRRDVWPDRR